MMLGRPGESQPLTPLWGNCLLRNDCISLLQYGSWSREDCFLSRTGLGQHTAEAPDSSFSPMQVILFPLESLISDGGPSVWRQLLLNQQRWFWSRISFSWPRSLATRRSTGQTDNNKVWLPLWVDLFKQIKLTAALAPWENTHTARVSSPLLPG